MPVYFMRSGDTGPVKIGWAADVEKRRRELQVSHPYPLQIIRTVEVARGAEVWLHRQYKAVRLLGEWFVFEDGMLTIEPPDLQAKGAWVKKVKPPLSEWQVRLQATMCRPGLGDPCDDCRRRYGMSLRPVAPDLLWADAL